MAFKTLSDLSTDNTVALGGFNKKTNKTNPTQITGYFLGSREVDSPKSKTGKAWLHVFQTADGNVGVWGKTDLDIKLKKAVVGALTRVTFTGMQKTKNNDMYKYRVEIDEEDKVEVAGGEGESYSSTSSDAADFSDSDDFGDVQDFSDDDVEDLPPPPQAPRTPARTPSADAQARTQALLARGRK